MPAKKTAETKTASAATEAKSSAKKLPRKVEAKTSAKDTGSTTNAVADGKLVPLKKICAELDLDTKTARRVLRKRMRSDVAAIAEFHAIGNRWNLTPKHATLVRSVLKEYAQA